MKAAQHNFKQGLFDLLLDTFLPSLKEAQSCGLCYRGDRGVIHGLVKAAYIFLLSQEQNML